MATKASDKKRWLGVVLVNGMGFWHYAATPDDAAKKTAKIAQDDLKSMGKFTAPIRVHIYDTKGIEQCRISEDEGVRDIKTGKQIPLHEIATLEPAKKLRASDYKA